MKQTSVENTLGMMVFLYPDSETSQEDAVSTADHKVIDGTDNNFGVEAQCVFGAGHPRIPRYFSSCLYKQCLPQYRLACNEDS